MALSGNHIEAAAYAYRKMAGVLEYASDFEGSIKAYDTALNLCRTQDLDFQALMCMSCMSWVLFRMGDWKQSIEVCKEIIDDASINDTSKSTAHLVVGLIRIYRGETKTAHKHIQQSATLAEKENFHIILLILHWAMAALQESETNAGDAYPQYCIMLADWQKLQDRHDVLPGLCSAVIFFSENGYRKEVDACAQIFSFLANDTGNPEAVGGLALALGEIALLAQKYETATEHLEQARHYFVKLSTPLQIVQTTFRLGIALCKAGKPASAEKYFQEALQEARKLGLRPLASAIESVLGNAGNPIDEKQETNKAPQNPAGLTPRQLEIIQELAKGASNKEIAAHLQLSTRTIDMHVSHILDYLNCRTRTEAVKVAVEQGLVN
jgi:DNA-binding NarL/FixJ family response regulator